MRAGRRHRTRIALDAEQEVRRHEHRLDADREAFLERAARPAAPARQRHVGGRSRRASTGRRNARAREVVRFASQRGAVCAAVAWPQVKIVAALAGDGPVTCAYGPPTSTEPMRDAVERNGFASSACVSSNRFAQLRRPARAWHSAAA